MLYDFISIGGATQDVSCFSPEGVIISNHHDILRQELLAFEQGAKIKIDKFYYNYGGGAANTAVNFAHFGLKTACLAILGKDPVSGDIIKNLKTRGVKTKLIKQIDKFDSGRSFILIDENSGERIIFTNRGANDKLKIESRDLDLLAKTKNIYLASLSGQWESLLNKVFTVSKKHQIKVFWNPGVLQYRAGLENLAKFIKFTHVFAVNKDEAIELAISSKEGKGKSNAFLNKVDNLAKIIKSFGPQITLITDGVNGAYAYDGDKLYFQDVIKEKRRVDTTGVGDLFNSTFSLALELYQGDIQRSLLLASRNAASKIAHLGAQNGLLKLK